jgi:hypothetical protein
MSASTSRSRGVFAVVPAATGCALRHWRLKAARRPPPRRTGFRPRMAGGTGRRRTRRRHRRVAHEDGGDIGEHVEIGEGCRLATMTSKGGGEVEVGGEVTCDGILRPRAARAGPRTAGERATTTTETRPENAFTMTREARCAPLPPFSCGPRVRRRLHQRPPGAESDTGAPGRIRRNARMPRSRLSTPEGEDDTLGSAPPARRACPGDGGHEQPSAVAGAPAAMAPRITAGGRRSRTPDRASRRGSARPRAPGPRRPCRRRSCC